MESGLRLGERYRLVERLGGGDTVEVWRAWDELLERAVAVKLLVPPAPGMHGEFREGLSRAAGLSHSAVATIYDYDRTRDDSGRLVSYVVREFLEGEDLAARIRRAPPTAVETVLICARIADALAAAHAAGVVHGDLRPGKVFLTCNGVKLVDMGVGVVLRVARERRVPEGGSVVPGGGRTPGAAAEAADVFALGAVLTECLTAGRGMDAPPPAGTPRTVMLLRERCCAADPADRPSAAEAAKVLARLVAGPPAGFPRRPRVLPANGPPARTIAPGRIDMGGLPPQPGRGRPASGRRGVVKATVVLAAAAAAAVLLGVGRGPATGLPAGGRGAASAEPTDGPTAFEPRDPDPAPSRSRTNTRAIEALGGLRPIVERGFTQGEIRSDVAVDLNNVITDLQNELVTGRPVDVTERIAQLREKIATRLRERGISAELAARLTSALAQIAV